MRHSLLRGTRLPGQQLFGWLADEGLPDEYVRELEVDRNAAAVLLRTANLSLCS